MEVVVIFSAIVLVVFLGVFLSGRRFGPLALSLAAGFMLSEIWADWLTIIISGLGFEIAGLPYGVISSVMILLAPLFMLLWGGPRYFKKIERAMSAIVIALLTAALLVEPLGKYMVLDGDALAVYRVMAEWWQYVVTAGLVIGLVDVFLLHTAKVAKPSKH